MKSQGKNHVVLSTSFIASVIFSPFETLSIIELKIVSYTILFDVFPTRESAFITGTQEEIRFQKFEAIQARI
jgi:hypothetical protein